MPRATSMCWRGAREANFGGDVRGDRRGGPPNRDPVLSRRLDELLETADVGIELLTADQGRLARQAYRDFGKGSGHPAGLNLGERFSCALAAAAGEPLLYKGDDFSIPGWRLPSTVAARSTCFPGTS